MLMDLRRLRYCRQCWGQQYILCIFLFADCVDLGSIWWKYQAMVEQLAGMEAWNCTTDEAAGLAEPE